MASNLAAPPTDPTVPDAPSASSASGAPPPRSRGPLLVVAAAAIVTVGAVAWLLVAGSLDSSGAEPAADLADSSASSPDPADASVSAAQSPPSEPASAALAPAEPDVVEPVSGDPLVAVSGPGESTETDDSNDPEAHAAPEPDVAIGIDASDATEGVGALDAPDASGGSSDVAEPVVEEPVGQPQSRAVFRDGQVILFGAVPTQEIADEIFDLAASVLGPENVVDDYVIDPTVPAPTTGNLTVEETIEFTSGAAVLPDPVPAILPVGVALMTARPTAELRLVGHTDGRGSDVANLALSIERAEAVKVYFIENGIDPDRIEVIGRGESRPVASDDTEAGRRENRRIEFEVSNILGEV